MFTNLLAGKSVRMTFGGGILIGIFILTTGDLSYATKAAELQNPHLHRAKIFLAAGDYRRAMEACQQQVAEFPSAESYVYLTYVYHALDGYLEWLAKRDDWVKVQQLSFALAFRGSIDLLDPPNALPRMAKELLHEGVRQQFDVTAAMANRLDKATVDRLWKEQAVWQNTNPDGWWAGVPDSWGW